MENKKLLFKALDSIHAEPERFNMEDFADDEYESGLSTPELIATPTCNTTMCLAGWVLHHCSQGDARKLELVPYATLVFTALGVVWDTEEWKHLTEIILLDKPSTPITPRDLVAQLEEYGILAKGEYSYVA